MDLKRFLCVALATLTCLCTATAAPDKWAAEIEKFVAQDAKQPPSPGGVVFVGSSSIRMWKSLAADFSDTQVVNRGFGGSQLEDSVHYFDELVLPNRPRLVVLYAGDNDLWSGKTPEQVLTDFRTFCEKVHAALPQARVAYIAIKPSPSRWKIRDAIVRANALIAAECTEDPRRVFVDIYTPMLDATGNPRRELYLEDMLHMNDSGYAIWKERVAPVLKP